MLGRIPRLMLVEIYLVRVTQSFRGSKWSVRNLSSYPSLPSMVPVSSDIARTLSQYQASYTGKASSIITMRNPVLDC